MALDGYYTTDIFDDKEKLQVKNQCSHQQKNQLQFRQTNKETHFQTHRAFGTDDKTLEDQEKKKKEEGEQEGVEKGIKISGKKKNEELSPVIQLVSGWSVSLLVFHSYLPCGFPVVVLIYICEFHP